MYLNTNKNTFLFGQIQILSFVKYLNTNTNTLESISNTNTNTRVCTPLKNPGKPWKNILAQNILENPWNFFIIPGKPWTVEMRQKIA